MSNIKDLGQKQSPAILFEDHGTDRRNRFRDVLSNTFRMIYDTPSIFIYLISIFISLKIGSRGSTVNIMKTNVARVPGGRVLKLIPYQHESCSLRAWLPVTGSCLKTGQHFIFVIIIYLLPTAHKMYNF